LRLHLAFFVLNRQRQKDLAESGLLNFKTAAIDHSATLPF
jgi:hypothetical protein